jgi:hypothetical protein
MKLGWKNILAISLIVSATAITACGKKGGNAGGGEAAAPPAAPASPTSDDSIPASTNNPTAIYSGSWKGQINVTNEDVYKAFVQDSGICRYKVSCQHSGGYVKLILNLAGQSLPRRLSSKSTIYSSKNVNSNVSDGAGLNLSSTIVLANADNGGFQLSRNIANDIGDGSQNGMLTVVAYYADGSRTNVNVKVLYNGIKLAEGPLGFFPSNIGGGGGGPINYPHPRPHRWQSGHNYHYNDWGQWDDEDDSWSSNGGSVSVGGSNGDLSGFFQFTWNN